MQLMAERSHMDVFIDQLRSDAFAFAGLVNLLTLAFCFDQLSSGETAACIGSHPTTYYENHVCKALRKIAISRTDLRYYGWLSGFRADSPAVRCDAPIPR